LTNTQVSTALFLLHQLKTGQVLNTGVSKVRHCDGQAVAT